MRTLKKIIFILSLLISGITSFALCDAALEKLTKDLNGPNGKALSEAIDKDGDLINAWESLQNAPDAIRVNIPSLKTVKKFADEGFEFTYETVDGAVSIKKGEQQIGTLVQKGDGVELEVADDLFVDVPIEASKKFDDINVVAPTADGETFVNAGFVKNSDGTIGFVEDVQSYGSLLVQRTIKKRGDLRKSFNSISSTEDAHHLFPVQSLKENQYIKKGVEGGFEFNSEQINGLAIQKYVKKTNTGRHGPHPQYTKQLMDHMDWWAEQSSIIEGVTVLNKNLSPAQTAEYMRVIADDVKATINTTTDRINLLDLGLDHL